MGRRSSEIIRGWSPAAFAEGMERAVASALPTSSRRFPAFSRAVLGLLSLASRHPRAFHSAPNA
jgi:hypothetical protein